MNLTRVTSTRADLGGRTREWVTPVGVVREVNDDRRGGGTTSAIVVLSGASLRSRP
ncbi:Uncharacterised protein [Mycobacteroides abscessus subsp. abscessus]|nr:Uncharacterised protein [Mycobacteroides abscessus subsp. abscessus]